MKKFTIISILLLSGLLGFSFSLYHAKKTPTLLSDVQTIQTFHYPALFVKQLQGDPKAGEKIFKEFCSACHNPHPLIDIKAPVIGDKTAWRPRRQLGMSALLQITINGVNAMPARGGCFECSDQQLREAIQYILNNS